MVVSFNYDTLLETAINATLGHGYNKVDDYINFDRSIFLYKPHGSCNWIRNFGISQGLSFEERNQFISTTLYKKKLNYYDIFKLLKKDIVIENEINFPRDRHQRYLPQLLIPFTDKDDFVMPLQHRNSLGGNLAQIDEILIIGWKGNEQVFKDLLRNQIGPRKVKITVANKGDETIRENFKDVLPNAFWETQGTFSDYMKMSLARKHLFNNSCRKIDRILND